MSVRIIRTIVFAALALAVSAGAWAQGTSMRIKDIANVEGARENQLVGFGLVVGLTGTGDGAKMTKYAVINMLDKFGIQTNINDIKVDNIAAVMVTATIPAFVKPGDTLDVTVSSVGDANSLRGGQLVQTPLKGADGQVYAVAQGALSIGGYSEGLGGANAKKGFPTSGRIPSGATVEKSVPTEIMKNHTIRINLNSPDFTTAARIQNVITQKCKTADWASIFGSCGAVAKDAASVQITAPNVDDSELVSFISYVETTEIDIDTVSRVVINEKTGTIIVGADVKIEPVEIAHGSLQVKIQPGNNVSQPTTPLGGGETVQPKQPNVKVVEPKVSFHKVKVGDIVQALNDMGVTPSDIIAILQALKASGALQAEIVTL